MSSTSESIQYRPLKAPRSHGSVLLEPGLARYAEEILANRRLFQSADEVLVDELPLPEFRRLARRNLLETACRHTWSYLSPFPLPETDVPLVLSGHQPALYHPGVWFKNFVAGSLAERTAGLAVHVIADSDVAALPSVLVPTGEAEELTRVRVPYDDPGDRLAWEMTCTRNVALLGSFAKRVKATLPRESRETLLDAYWPEVMRQIDQGDPPGLAFSKARHRLEAAWGNRSLEVPLGQLCGTEGFYRFTLHLLRHLPRLHLAYNESVRAYRGTHRIRSTSHPVPCLEEVGAALEAPLWVWTDAQPHRRRLLVRQVGDNLELSDQEGWHAEVPAEGESAVRALGRLADEGVYLRPKALLTTMYMRMALADGFIHGIGGAKYDQVTDSILSRFFGLTAPGFQVATSTIHLPLPTEEPPDLSVQEVESQLRDLRFNPDRFLSVEARLRPGVSPLLEAKRDLLAEVPQKKEKIAWHQRLTEVNRQFEPLVGQAESRLLELLAEASTAADRQAVRDFREYPWTLYPEHTLRNLLLDLSHDAA